MGKARGVAVVAGPGLSRALGKAQDRRAGDDDGIRPGQVQQQHDVDKQYFGEGIAVLPDKIVTLTWKHGKGFILDRATLKQTGEFSYPGEGWALTTDGSKIYMSDGTAQIRVLDPATLAETGRLLRISRAASTVSTVALIYRRVVFESECPSISATRAMFMPP